MLLPAAVSHVSHVSNSLPPARGKNRTRASALLPRHALLWQPAHLLPSPFQQHAPFAWWLAEALRPALFVAIGARGMAAHLAVCQAVQRLDLDTRCAGIQTGAGGDDNDARRAVQHELHYSAFSELCKETAPAALARFRAGEIDWLHLDSPDIVESLRTDWPKWHRALSQRAVITVHGSALRQPGPAIRLLDTLQRQYPSLEFVHGHGLLLLCTGAQRNASVDQLLREFADPCTRQPLRALFSRLGQGCVDTCKQANDASASESEDRQRHLAEAAQQQRKIDDLQSRLTRAETTQRESQARVQAAEQKLQAEAARATRLDGECKSAQQAQQTAEKRADDSAATAAAAAKAQQAALSALQDELKQAKSELQQQARRLDDRFRELGTLTAMIEERERELATLREMLASQPANPVREVLSTAAQLQLIAQSGLFDTDWYLATYPDVIKQRCSALEHFVRSGAAEMRNPSASFDTRWYCSKYPDVIASGLNPLLHYIRHGRKDGRATSNERDNKQNEQKKQREQAHA